MKTAIQVIILAVIALGVFGGAAYFAYELFWKPSEEEVAEQKAAAEPTPEPTPHPSIDAFDEIVKAGESGMKPQDLQQALIAFMEQYPDSPRLPEARAELGQLNAAALFSATPGPNKESYTVVSGDSISKISSKHSVPMDLLFRVNGMTDTMLRVGQPLLVPKLKITGTIDTTTGVLTIYNQGAFFKDYRVNSPGGPAPASGTVLEVVEKSSSIDGKRVAFGDKQYWEGDRMIRLSPLNISIVEESDSPPAASLTIPPGEFDEIFLLASPGVKFTVQ